MKRNMWYCLTRKSRVLGRAGTKWCLGGIRAKIVGGEGQDSLVVDRLVDAGFLLTLTL